MRRVGFVGCVGLGLWVLSFDVGVTARVPLTTPDPPVLASKEWTARRSAPPPVDRRPEARRGIPMGDGSFLPPLNGVRVEDGIPPIRRDPRLPPPGPVVRKQVDESGQEWWVHADGSQTSCSYASITVAGVDRVIVSTQHGAARPGGHGALGVGVDRRR
jgi:hypothetical protein